MVKVAGPISKKAETIRLTNASESGEIFGRIR